MAMVVVMAALVGAGVWAAVRLEGHMDTPATPAGQPPGRHPGGPPAPAGPGLRTSAPAALGGRGTSAAGAGTPPASETPPASGPACADG